MPDKKFLFCLFYFTFVVCILATNANYASFPANENGTCYKRVPYDEAIAINISRGIIKTAPGSQQAGVKTKANRGVVTILDCCEGFIRNESTGKCETHCEEGCFGGTCTGPNICTCGDGWRPESGVCKPVCRRGCADNAYCFSPDICTCKFGFEEEEGICKPVCRHSCKNGRCVAPRECRCNPGYFLNETQHCEPVCEGGCPHGRCVEPGICECDRGYDNPVNDRETCTPSCPDTCTGTFGQCHSPNVCTCDPGYTQTSRGTCIPECLGDCPNGECVAPEQCKCNQGFVLNRQERRCVEAPKGQGGYYESPVVNISNRNNYNNPTVPPETTNGGRGTYRPEDSSQLGRPVQGLKRPQSQQNYGTREPGRAHGTQGVVKNSYRPESEEDDDDSYGTTERRNHTRKINNVVGLNGDTNSNHNINHSPNSRENSYPYDEYENNSNTTSKRPGNSQGPFAPLDPYHPDHRRPNQTNPLNRNPSYETYGTSQTSRPHRPVNQQGPFPSQGPHSSRGYNDTYDSRRPDETSDDKRRPDETNYDDRRYNQSQSPYDGPYPGPSPTRQPEQGLYPKLPSHPRQDPYDEQGRYPGQRPRPTQAPNLYPKLPRIPGQPHESTHDSRDLESPYESEHNEQSPNRYGQVPTQNPRNPSDRNESSQSYKPTGPYNTSARGQSGNPHETVGVKGSNRRPRPEYNGSPGLELTYGIHESQNIPHNTNVNLRPGSSVVVGLYDPYNPSQNGETDNIYILEPGFYNPLLPLGPVQIDPGFAPATLPGYAPICESPCINSLCVGHNVCQCKPGYEPDPRNPNGFKCVPTCSGGCINGVCSAPNLCLCNVGFMKEHGVKGVQRCVPSY